MVQRDPSDQNEDRILSSFLTMNIHHTTVAIVLQCLTHPSLSPPRERDGKMRRWGGAHSNIVWWAFVAQNKMMIDVDHCSDRHFLLQSDYAAHAVARAESERRHLSRRTRAPRKPLRIKEALVGWMPSIIAAKMSPITARTRDLEIAVSELGLSHCTPPRPLISEGVSMSI